MSVSYHTYLYIGIKLKEHLDVQTGGSGYYKHDPRTGEETKELVVEQSIHTIKFGNKTLVEKHKGDVKFNLHEDGIDKDLLKFEYSDKFNLFFDYEDCYDSVVGVRLFDTGDLSYGGENTEFTIEELQETIKSVKDLFKEKFDLDVEPRLIIKSAG